VKDLAGCMRVRQWTKNTLIFASLVFSRHLHVSGSAMRSVCAFVLFSLVASSVYILNDIIDLDRDRLHPVKKNRPIPSGRVGIGAALAMSFVIAVPAVVLSFILCMGFGITVMIYIMLQVLYTIVFKNMVILDVLVISMGFLLRVVAGAVVIGVPISNWILVCTMLLALFLVLSKRRNEIVLLEGEADTHRLILREYSPYLLDQMIGVVTSATLVAYMIFTLSQETIDKFGKNMVLTVPFVLYGIFRYLYLVHHKNKGGQPEEILLSDIPLQIDILLYLIVSLLVIYR